MIDRLAYFERKHKFYDQKQLLSEITGHYSQQVIQVDTFDTGLLLIFDER